MDQTHAPGRRPPPSPEEIIDWGNRYLAGATASMLARLSGRTTGSIEHHLKTNDFLKKLHPDAVFCWRGTAAFEASRACAVEAPPESGPEPGRRAAYRVKGDAVWAMAQAAYLSGWSARRVAEHFGVTEAALRKRAARAGWRKCDLPDVAEPMPAPWESKVCGAPSTVSRAPSPSAGDGEEKAARPELKLHAHQRPPEGDWSTWLVLGGRGAGKTLAGASWIAAQAEALGARGRIALVGATLHDVREVMIEGPSGILSLPRWFGPEGWKGPTYAPSRRRMTFPGGCEGHVFSAEDPDSLRGPQFHCAWADEVCAWSAGRADADTPEAGTLAMLRLGLRLGADPRLVLTTTPRPTRALKALMAEPGIAITRAGTAANAAHLSPGFVEGLKRLYGGTRLAAQEIEGQVVETAFSLWTAAMIAGCRSPAPETLDRVVVGLDPTATRDGAACGVVVVGRRGDEAFVLADRTVGGVSPEGWARQAIAAARDYRAQAIVAEVNQGGDMVKSVLKAARCAVTIVEVRASAGKRARAEPVAALYEQGRVRHAAEGLERLEEALMAFGEAESAPAGALDRADALVWAVTALMLGPEPGRPRLRGLAPPPRPWGVAGRQPAHGGRPWWA